MKNKLFTRHQLWFLLILLAMLTPSAETIAQNFPPPEDDDEMMLQPGPGVGEGRMHRTRRGADKSLRFNWEDAEKYVLPYIKKDNPALYQFILTNKENKTALTQRITRGLAVLVNVQENHGDKFKEIYRIHSEELEIERLAVLYQQESNPVKKNELKVQIKTKLTAVFDLKEKVREELISRLEENLSRQKKEFQQRQERKGKIVEKRLKKLLEDNDDLDW